MNNIIEVTRRNCSVTSEQKRLMIEFIKKNPVLTSGKFRADFTQKDSQCLWQNLANVLNSCPGATKEWKSWRKTWQDIRSRTKVKHSKLRTHREATGGGGPETDVLTSFESEILDIIKTVSVEGHMNISESDVDFSFDINTMNSDDKPLSSIASSSETTPVKEQRERNQTDDKSSSSKGDYSHKRNLVSSSEATPVRKQVERNQTEGTSSKDDSSHKRKLELRTSNLSSINLRKTPRKKLLNAAQASESYRLSLEQKNEIKKNYYEKKIALLERMTIAKEKSAIAKEKMAENIGKLGDILQEII